MDDAPIAMAAGICCQPLTHAGAALTTGTLTRSCPQPSNATAPTSAATRTRTVVRRFPSVPMMFPSPQCPRGHVRPCVKPVRRAGACAASGYEASVLKIVDHTLSVLGDGPIDRIERDLWLNRRFVRIGHAGHLLDLAALRRRIQALDVALHDDVERRADVDLDECGIAARRVDHCPDLVARRAIRADQRADHRAAVANDFGRDEPD